MRKCAMDIWLDDPELLQQYRLSPERWDELACFDGQDEEGRWCDANAAARYHVLIVLQYHQQRFDMNLVRFLFQQEVLRHKQEPFQGYIASLSLATYLLANYRNVE